MLPFKMLKYVQQFHLKLFHTLFVSTITTIIFPVTVYGRTQYAPIRNTSTTAHKICLRQFLQSLSEVDRQGFYRIYLDEAFICEYATRKNSTIVPISHSETNKQYNAAKNKIRRWVIFDAMGDHGWVPDSRCIFKTDPFSMVKMNSQQFQVLFKQLCANAFVHYGSCAMIMDNVPYHKVLAKNKRISYLATVPTKQLQHMWNTGLLVASNNIKSGLEKKLTKKEILNKVRENGKQGELKIEEIAKTYGHKIICLPPNHTHLNAIETAWQVCKYNVNTTKKIEEVGFHDLDALINEALDDIGPAMCRRFIRNVMKKEEKYQNKI